MKKLILMVLSLFLTLTICACGTSNDTETKGDAEIKGDVETENNKKEENISWTDYKVGPVSNLTAAYFADKDGRRVDADSAQGEVEIKVDTFCPYCKSDRWVDVIKLEELPIEELGNQTILFETTTMCGDWANHWETSEFKISILLTLNK